MFSAGEIARSFEEEREMFLSIAKGRNSKSVKESALRRVREIDRILGIEGENYNGGKF
jgi:hypothetical protein